jgi:hypothetical protein
MSDRVTARLVGVLFIVATVAAIVGGVLVLPAEEQGAVVDAASNDGRIVTGFVVELVLVGSVVGIATTLFPALRRTDEGLALGYVAARLIEGVLLLAAAVSPLLVLALSRGAGSAAGGEGLGGLLTTARDWTYLVGSMVAVGASALILYSLLYRARLVPVWLSLWGLAGGALILLRSSCTAWTCPGPCRRCWPRPSQSTRWSWRCG